MASEKEANLARDKFSDELKNLGVHALAVNEVNLLGKKTFAVIAFVDKNTGNIPETLEIVVSNKTLKVPLIKQRSKKFRLE